MWLCSGSVPPMRGHTEHVPPRQPNAAAPDVPEKVIGSSGSKACIKGCLQRPLSNTHQNSRSSTGKQMFTINYVICTPGLGIADHPRLLGNWGGPFQNQRSLMPAMDQRCRQSPPGVALPGCCHICTLLFLPVVFLYTKVNLKNQEI